MKRKLKFILPGIYLILCLNSWLMFQGAPPDGLANLPLIIITLPSILIIKFIPLDIWKSVFHSLGFPDSYIVNHVYWFLPMVMFQSLCLYWIGRRIGSQKPKSDHSTHG